MSSPGDYDLSDPSVVARLRAWALANPNTLLAHVYCEAFPHDDAACYDNGTTGFYGYRVSLAANVAFAVVFAVSLAGFLVTFLGAFCCVVRRRWRGTAWFSLALVLGTILELLGYIGRSLSANNQYKLSPFLLQICALTLGPAFIAAALYLCLRRIVQAFGRENSRLPPKYYTRIFIPCDVISLILQGAGGGIASVAAQNNKDISAGNNTMIAGLAFQSFTLLAFIVVSLDFAWRVRRRHHALGAASALDQNPVLVRLRATWRFRLFVAAVALASMLVLWRSVFRIAELSDGWDGAIIQMQGLFIGLEGVLIVVAVAVLNVFHPAWCAPELFSGLGSTNSEKNAAATADVETEQGTVREKSVHGLATPQTGSNSQLAADRR